MSSIDYSKLYSSLREIKKFGHSADVYEKVKKSVKGFDKVDHKKFDNTLNVIWRTAHACDSAKEFETAITTNNLPSIKLTKEEMEAVRGGVWPLIIAGVVCLVAMYECGNYIGKAMN